MKRIVAAFLLLFPLATFGQSVDWQEALRQWMTAEDMEGTYGEETLEWLEERAASKLNINQTSREELEELPFLNASQVEALVAYVERYRPVRSLSELQMVPTLDYETRRLLSCFVEVGPEKPRRLWPTIDELTNNGKHTVMVTGKIPFYDRKGDIVNSDKGYLGYKYRHDVRYQYNYYDRIKFGITGAQDAGEPFFSASNRTGYDHYSYYVQFRKMGRLESLNLGMYRVQMGMGLVMNTGFSLGKLATLQTLGRSTHTVTAHSSRSSQGYFQGAAATVNLSPRWQVTAFASYRGVDATLTKDGAARTLLTDGYHRTLTEMGKKHNTHRTDVGGRLSFRPRLKEGHGFLNLNAVYTHFDRPLQPQTTTLYRRYAAVGSRFFNASLDYGYTNSRLSISGETAVNRLGAVATIHAASYRLSDELTLMALHRYYDKRYTALHGRSFGEGSSVQNEHGIYVGATWRPSRYWLFQGYADYSHAPWARYQVTAASDAFDTSLSAKYTKGLWVFDGRYRFHLRQRDNSSKTLLENRPEHRLRLRAHYTPVPQLTLQTQVDAVSTRSKGGASSAGIMVSQQASWQWRWLRANGHVGWFRTDNYDSRLYQYERSVQHDFASYMFYGHGLRYTFLVHATIGSHLQATAKVGVTDYFDRPSISSGMQQIARSSMTDLLVQLSCRL